MPRTPAPARAAWIPCLLLLAAAPAGADPVTPAQLPVWKAPEAYKVDLVMSSGDRTFTMKRFISKGRFRTEIESGGQTMVMIEPGDEKHTTYSLMPKQKTAIKQTAQTPATATPDSARDDDAKIEFVGAEKLEGADAKRYRITSHDTAVDAWFGAASGAPLRMESDGENGRTVMEWKNLEAGPQPDKLFEVPKDYDVVDMDEMMAQAREAMGKVAGLGRMPGMTGGVAGMPTGANVGASLGATFGGFLGTMAGPYLGGQVGGWVSPGAGGK